MFQAARSARIAALAEARKSFCYSCCTICYSTAVIPFRVQFRPGISLHEQVVYAAKKAIVSGAMRAGDPFPSVRTLSKELKINPNTAHKIVMKLVNDGLLETRPGIGNLVATLPESSKQERTQLLENEIEQLVVEARKLGIEFAEIVQSMESHWKRLGPREPGGPQKNELGGRKR